MIISLDANRLADRYVIAAYSLPDELRMRKPLAEGISERLAGGRNVCIRGFWRIGKTDLMKAVVGGACRRSGANGFFFDMRSSDDGSSLPQSKEEVFRQLGQMVGRFCAQAAPGLNVDRGDPLGALGSIGAPVYVGLDEMIALGSIPPEDMGEVISYIKSGPANVRLAVVCHRNRSVDEAFRKGFEEDPAFDTAYVPRLTDAEHAAIVAGPASQSGIAFTDGALARLAAMSGNKPWEAFIFSHLAATALEKTGGSVIDEDLIDSSVTLEALMDDYHGREVVENYGRMLIFAMSGDEKEVMTALASGAPEPFRGREEAASSLERSGWISLGPSPMIEGRMFGEFIRALASGKLNISTG